MDWMPSSRLGMLCVSAFRLFGILLVAMTAALAARADGPGKWTPSTSPWDWRRYTGDTRHGVHMILLPGDGSPYHSRILWWREEKSVPALEFSGGMWGWRDTCVSDRCASVPSSPCFDTLSVALAGMDPFCAGHTQLDNGTLLTAGGTDRTVGFYGENDSRIFYPGTGTSGGTWSSSTDTDSMSEFRWYPTTVTLGDGRVLVLSGSKYRHHRIFGGRRNGSLPTDPSDGSLSVGDSLYRFAPLPGGAMDKSVIPTAASGNLRPDVRESHTFIEMDSDANVAAEVLFGGRGTDGHARNDTWFLTRGNNVTGADYAYAWGQRSIFGNAPAKRSDHTAVQTLVNNSYGMVVLSGRGDGDTLRTDVKRLAWNADQVRLEWFDVDTTGSGTGPSARFGQTAIFDNTTGQSRMIVFGGVSDSTTGPTDSDVWELRFNATNPNAATWHKMVDTAITSPVRKPSPRYWHTMVHDPVVRDLAYYQAKDCTAAFLYGGVLPSGAYSDTLWTLLLLTDGKYAWRPGSITGDMPGKRARHTAIYDPLQRWESAGRL